MGQDIKTLDISRVPLAEVNMFVLAGSHWQNSTSQGAWEPTLYSVWIRLPRHRQQAVEWIWRNKSKRSCTPWKSSIEAKFIS